MKEVKLKGKANCLRSYSLGGFEMRSMLFVSPYLKNSNVMLLKSD